MRPRLTCEQLIVGSLVLAAVIAAALITACSPAPIIVGGLISETGVASSYGKMAHLGMDLALEEVNAAGGLPRGRRLQLEHRDDGSAPDRAKAVARQLVDQVKVAAIIGGVSSAVALEVVPLARDREIVFLSPSASSPQLTTVGGGWFFRVYPSDMAEVQVMGALVEQLGINAVAVLAYNDPFGQGIADIFANQLESGSARVVVRESFDSPLAPQQAKALAKKVVDARCQAVYIPAYLLEVATLLQELQTAGFHGVKMATSAVTPEIARLAGAAAERLVFPQQAAALEGDDPHVRRFVEAFRKKYNQEPNIWAAFGYDAVKVFGAALVQTKMGTAGEIRGQLANIRYMGVTGPIKFDAHGDVLRDARLHVVVRGEMMEFQGLDPGIRGVVLP